MPRISEIVLWRAQSSIGGLTTPQSCGLPLYLTQKLMALFTTNGQMKIIMQLRTVKVISGQRGICFMNFLIFQYKSLLKQDNFTIGCQIECWLSVFEVSFLAIEAGRHDRKKRLEIYS